MALPATHIRFAATLADRLGVTDRAAYLSGTLYPDSRWMTGVNRRQTHDRRFLDPGFPSDDYTLGWHIHCLCDHIQSMIHTEIVGHLPDSDDTWIRMSAAKLVQDMNDAIHGQLDLLLPMLTCLHTPNDETPEAVAAYFDAVRRAYSGKGIPAWPDYSRLWHDVGLDDCRISKIRRQMQRLLTDTALTTRLHGAFDTMVARWMANGTIESSAIT